LLTKPQTYMNLSGQAVEPICRRYLVAPEQVLVVHDDMDLSFGRIQIRRGGGDGGHRGVRSVIEHLKSKEFVRLRLGVGRPDSSQEAADHVLQVMDQAQLGQAASMLARAVGAIECWLEYDLTTAMNRFNSRKAPRS
jgi:PTH1 family peptidyl-tRNA hydrolase